MLASVIILTKNGQQWLVRSLSAIFAQQGVSPFEIIIVDSGSSDSTLEIARSYPVIIDTIPPESFHHARTRNYAAKRARGDVLFFLSQDAVPAHPGWLASMLANFEDADVGAVYGRQLPARDAFSERHDVLSMIYGERRVVKCAETKRSLGYRYYHFSDANSAIRRSVWEATRFPEAFKVFEDMAIAKQILDNGWKIVYEPQGCVYHSHNHTAIGLFKRYFDLGVTYRRLGAWDRYAWLSMQQDFVRLLTSKLMLRPHARVAGNRGASTSQNVAKASGLLLGICEKYLPLIFKRRLSAYGVFG